MQTRRCHVPTACPAKETPGENDEARGSLPAHPTPARPVHSGREAGHPAQSPPADAAARVRPGLSRSLLRLTQRGLSVGCPRPPQVWRGAVGPRREDCGLCPALSELWAPGGRCHVLSLCPPQCRADRKCSFQPCVLSHGLRLKLSGRF